jgi:hypothetical protein
MPPENLTTFDPSQAELRWEDGKWDLVAGEVRLREFGNRTAEAREALRLIRGLHLTQHGTVGTPQPVMEYWLSDGHAPLAASARPWARPFDPDGLRVEQVEGHWCVRNDEQILFAFGPHEDQARQAQDIIRRYEFNRIGYVGQPVPEMILFLNSPLTGAHMAVPASSAQSVGTGNFTVVNPATQALSPEGKGAAVSGPGGRFPDMALTQMKPLSASQAKLKNELGGLAQLQVRQLNMAGMLTPEPGFLGERVPFSSSQVQLRCQKGDWVLCSGSTILAHFGTNSMEARDALRILEYYGFTEQRRVGSPSPVFSYFLINGRPAGHPYFGIPSVPFHPDALSLRQMGAGYAICDGERVVLPVQGKVEDAQHILQIIKQEHFDGLCQIGSSPAAGMTFFVRSH